MGGIEGGERFERSGRGIERKRDGERRSARRYMWTAYFSIKLPICSALRLRISKKLSTPAVHASCQNWTPTPSLPLYTYLFKVVNMSKSSYKPCVRLTHSGQGPPPVAAVVEPLLVSSACPPPPPRREGGAEAREPPPSPVRAGGGGGGIGQLTDHPQRSVAPTEAPATVGGGGRGGAAGGAEGAAAPGAGTAPVAKEDGRVEEGAVSHAARAAGGVGGAAAGARPGASLDGGRGL